MKRFRAAPVLFHMLHPPPLFSIRPIRLGPSRLSMMNVALAVVAVCLLTPSAPLHAQWVQLDGPPGGAVNCFLSSGTNLFAGTADSGVFVSTNDGVSWTPVNNGLTNTHVQSLAVSGTNLFAGTGQFFAAQPGGVFFVHQ